MNLSRFLRLGRKQHSANNDNARSEWVNDINLLSALQSEKTGLISVKNLFLAISCALVVAIGAQAVFSYQLAKAEASLAQKRKQLENVKLDTGLKRDAISRLEGSTDIKNQTEEMERLISEKTRLLDIIGQNSIVARSGYYDYLSALSAAKTSDVKISALTILESGAIQITGEAASVKSIPAYIAKLAAQPAFAGSVFASIKVEPLKPAPGESTESVSFTLSPTLISKK